MSPVRRQLVCHHLQTGLCGSKWDLRPGREVSCVFPTGVDNIPIQLMKCITVEQCKDTVTTYMGFSISNKSEICKSAVRNGARIRAPTPIFLILFLKKLLH